MGTPDESGETTEGRLRVVEGEGRGPGRVARLRAEIRAHPFGYTVLGLFLLAGPIVTPFLFPQAPPAVAIVGGLAFGAYAALCAVPQKFI